MGAKVRGFLPPVTVAAGLAKKRVLEMSETPPEFVRLYVPLVLGLWALEAVLFFAVVTSFLFHWAESWRWILVPAAILTGLVSGVASVQYLRKAQSKGDTSVPPRGAGILFDTYLGEATIVVLAVALAAFLILFVLFVIWLPLLLGLIAVLSFGELWRDYRAFWFGTDSTAALGEVGRDLVWRGAVLSKSWDPHLPKSDRARADAIRQAHYRVHTALITLGLSSLTLAVTAVLMGTILSLSWLPILLVAAAGATVGCAVFLGWALVLRRRFRAR